MASRPVARIGIDLGGTKIEGILLGPDGTERQRRRVATPRGDYDASIHTIVELVAMLERDLETRATVGVGAPGAVSPATGLIKNANSTWLIGRPLHRDLSAALDRPVRTDNDANCLALSEATDGAGAGAAIVFAAILGTGCGGGLAIGGRPHAGRNAVAGEWGHNPLPWALDDEVPGPSCYCGLAGCIETWLSGPGMAADHKRRTGSRLTAADIGAAADAGDAGCADTLDRYADRLGRALAAVVNMLDPDIIVLGGGVSNLDRLYRTVPPLMRRHVLGGEATTPIVRARHGDSSGVRGAAWLWQD